jgi:hypothetical protein
MTNTIDFKKLGKHGLNDGGVTSVVFMNNGNDQLLVEANDTVVGGSGIDSVGVHSGNCLIYGGDGPMAIYMNQPLVRSTVPASGSAEVIGGGGPLAFFGGPESSTVFGGQSTTSIAGGTGAVNILVGGTGDSTVTGNGTFDFIIAGTGNATLTANGMNSTVFGGNGSDVITASSVSGASTARALRRPARLRCSCSCPSPRRVSERLSYRPPVAHPIRVEERGGPFHKGGRRARQSADRAAGVQPKSMHSAMARAACLPSC